MSDKYQKDSQAASFIKHKEVLVWNAQTSMFFVVAELNNVILEFTEVKAVMKAEGPVSAVPVNYIYTTPEILVLAQ